MSVGDEWLATLSKRCSRGMVAGDELFARICTVSHQMLTDRGYDVPRYTPAHALAAAAEGVVVASGCRKDGDKAALFLDFDDRTGVKRIRSLIEAHEGVMIVVVSLDGITPFAKRELLGNDRIQIFLARELVHNVTHHSLVPKHEALSDDEVESVSERYNILPNHWMILPQTDPVARYYAWPVGTIVRIERTGVSQDVHVVYRRVARTTGS